MSGGVDSSVAAYLMKEKGYECIGITIKTFNETGDGIKRENTCCSLDDVSDARSVACTLGIRHFLYNFICRFVKRNEKDVQTVLFTVNEENQEIDVTEMELILETLEKAIYTSLRRSDVSTRYSSKQIVVILM